jgi:hypothetical protein
MTLREHLDRLEYGDHRPRVVQHTNGKYVAWLPTWEGPARFDYAAAFSDLIDRRQNAKAETP